MRKVRGILFLYLLCVSFFSQAVHFVSGEIYWKHVGNRVFDVYVVYYNDCAGYLSNFSTQLEIDGTNGYINRPRVGLRHDTIRYSPSACGGPLCAPYKLMIRSEGRFRVDLSQDTSSSYTFKYSECCRSNAITNVDLSGSVALNLFGRVNLATTDSQYWSSPYFIGDHQFTASTGGIHQVSFMADDTVAGIDSIAYELISPLTGTNPVPYYSGYSYQSPLKYLGYPY
ncbi:MAG: hypothetical protein GC180_01420 [Bacteroidetes bacterium]|nr:hypothetical protein [Bacteroidota bacterium]